MSLDRINPELTPVEAQKLATDYSSIRYAEGKHERHGNRLNFAHWFLRSAGFASTGVAMASLVMQPVMESVANALGRDDYSEPLNDANQIKLFAAGAVLTGLGRVTKMFRDHSRERTEVLGSMADSRVQSFVDYGVGMDVVSGQEEAGIAASKKYMFGVNDGIYSDANYLPPHLNPEYRRVDSELHPIE